jgi:hypothetical protein
VAVRGAVEKTPPDPRRPELTQAWLPAGNGRYVVCWLSAADAGRVAAGDEYTFRGSFLGTGPDGVAGVMVGEVADGP